MGSRYELTLTPDYVKDWTLFDALREIFQNALDQQEVSKEPYYYSYNEEEMELKVVNPKSWLDRSTLLLGKSSKLDDSKTIGKFGEGYKLAMLVFLREGLSVRIENQNYNEVWVGSIPRSRRFKGERVLQIDIDGQIKYSHEEDKSLVFIIGGLKADIFSTYINNYNLNLLENNTGELHRFKTKNGEVLLDHPFKGKIFINGLFVGEMDKLYYGYNFSPDQLPLDRDRRVLPSFDTLWQISYLWKQNPSDLIIPIIENDSADGSYFNSVTKNHSEIASKLLSDFQKKYGINAYPVSSQEEFDYVKKTTSDYNPIITSKLMSFYLRASSNLPELGSERVLSLKGQFEIFRDTIKSKLTKEEIEEFNKLISRIY